MLLSGANQIPEDADPATKLYMRAQIVIQSAFYAFGDLEAKPGTATLSSHELNEVLAFAIAMMLVTNKDLKSRRDFRLEAEHLAKFIATSGSNLRETGDTTTQQLLDALHMAISTPS